MGHKYVKEEDTFSISANGTVPKPTAQEVADNKFLRADGTWKVGGGGSEVEVDQVVTSGIEIGGVTVDGVRTALYAPLRTYSETEQRVGTWIDGKPVYEKVKTFGAIAANTSNYLIDTGITSADKIINIITMARNGDNYFKLPLALPSNTQAWAIWQQGFNKTNGKLRIDTASDRSVNDGFIIIQYTKTTDQV